MSLQWVNHLLDLDPHNPELWLKKAVCFRDAMVGTLPRKVLLERVLLWFRQGLREDPNNWVYSYNIAVVLRELNRHEEACVFARRAVELSPESPNAQELLLLTLSRLGYYPDHEIPDVPSAAKIYRDSEAVSRRMRSGDVSFVVEAADPELFTLQFEVYELITLGLLEAAQDVCIHFELTHGSNGLTRSSFVQLKGLAEFGTPRIEADVSPAYPLLEIATHYLPHEYLGIINYIFEENQIGRFIAPGDVDDFDDQIRWLLGQLPDPAPSFNDPISAVKPIPPELAKVWCMAVLNFVVARKLGQPLLIAYAATTLAEFYARLAESNLPLILYKITAVNAEEVRHWDYLVNARGKCASILRERLQVGVAVNHLEKALKYADKVAPFNRFHLFYLLAQCYSELSYFEKARTNYSKAQAVQGVSGDLLERARRSLIGLEAMMRGDFAHVGLPPVLCDGLELRACSINTPMGLLPLFVTSKHELYDCLLQAFDNMYRIRQSLLDREKGYAYFQGYGELMEALVHAALEIELAGNALMHLETQKNLILNNRLKYLVREKPTDLPDALWEDLQRLVLVYRRMTERTEDPEGSLEAFGHLTLADVAEGIGAKLWECRQVTEVAARQMEQKLAFGKFPQVVECADPEHSRILEFCAGACFIVHPDDPQNPEAVALPEATPQESERLAKDLFGIIEEWMDHSSQFGSLAAPALSERFERFLNRLDEVFYRPIASRLDPDVVKHVCLVPHRMLHVLPLNLLGSSEHPHGSLGERFAVSFAPSLTYLASLHASSPQEPGRFLIVANPVPTCPRGICRNPDFDCFSIQGAAHEARALDNLARGFGFDVVRLQGNRASVKAVATELGEANIVHFATHGWFDARQPENSGLLLCLPPDVKEDCSGRYLLHDHSTSDRNGPFSIGEILTLDYLWKNVDMFSCRLLNLSACSTAMVDWTERSDEFYGIANGFLYAGAQSILSNLWPVHDFASEVFNVHFYKEFLNHRGTAGISLKVAIDGIRNVEVGGIKPFAHPFFWAGYRVIGF